MESMRNRAEAYGCLEIAKGYIKKKKLHSALRLSIRAYKLFPTPASKLFMKALKSKVEQSNSKDFYSNQLVKKKTVPVYSSEESDGEDSDTSTCYDSYLPQSPEQPKKKLDTTTVQLIEMSDEINKAESLKCLRKAEDCIIMNQIDMAEQFVTRAKQLRPTIPIDEFCNLLREIREHATPKYTEEQENIVKSVENSENYYSMFGLKYTATVTEIREAYEYVAFLLNPDKNAAPGSREAFKVICNAVDILCDDEKRKNYDRALNILPSSPPNLTLKDTSNEQCQSPKLDNQFWSSLDFFFDSEREEYDSEREEYDSEREEYDSEQEEYDSDNKEYDSDHEEYVSEHEEYVSEHEEYIPEHEEYVSESEEDD